MRISKLTKILLDEIVKIQQSNNKGKTEPEIERRFFVKSLPPNLDKYPHAEITQGYLKSNDGTSIRIREIDDKYYTTTKTGSGKIRIEKEAEISKTLFNSLWHLTKDRRLTKTRYEIPYQGHTIQLDTYHGKLEGFVTVEVEFEDEKTCDEFIPLDWFGKEVTDDGRYSNKSLATHGLPE